MEPADLHLALIISASEPEKVPEKPPQTPSDNPLMKLKVTPYHADCGGVVIVSVLMDEEEGEPSFLFSCLKCGHAEEVEFSEEGQNIPTPAWVKGPDV